MKTIKRLLLISRPVSWPNTAYPFAAGYLLLGGSFDFMLVLGTLFFLVPYNLLMYGINDVFDYESDIKNPRKGGIEGMREQRTFHPIIIRASLLSCLPFVLFLLASGPALSRLVLMILLFDVVAYSAKGLRFKEKPVLDSISSSVHFVGPLLYATSLLGAWGSVWPYATAFFLWGMASHALGAIQDIIPDRKGGIASIATVFGAKPTLLLAGFLYSAACLLTLMQGWPAAALAVIGALYIINLLPHRHVTDKTSAAVNAAWRRFIPLNYLTGFVLTIVLIIGNLPL